MYGTETACKVVMFEWGVTGKALDIISSIRISRGIERDGNEKCRFSALWVFNLML